MDNIFVYIIAMGPLTKEHAVANLDGTFSIFINDYFSPEWRMKAYNHALSRIKNGDVDKKADVDTIEYQAHGSIA